MYQKIGEKIAFVPAWINIGTAGEPRTLSIPRGLPIEAMHFAISGSMTISAVTNILSMLEAIDYIEMKFNHKGESKVITVHGFEIMNTMYEFFGEFPVLSKYSYAPFPAAASTLSAVFKLPAFIPAAPGESVTVTIKKSGEAVWAESGLPESGTSTYNAYVIPEFGQKNNFVLSNWIQPGGIDDLSAKTQYQPAVSGKKLLGVGVVCVPDRTTMTPVTANQDKYNTYAFNYVDGLSLIQVSLDNMNIINGDYPDIFRQRGRFTRNPIVEGQTQITTEPAFSIDSCQLQGIYWVSFDEPIPVNNSLRVLLNSTESTDAFLSVWYLDQL